ncbi:MAG TPA: enoyl-CoA hydratase [Stellaceae bacterium]|nr:enoyl-CoA hydratase [Stellaceae bacterium]
MERVLLETLEEGVLTLTMNRPDRLNALNRDMLEALSAAITRAAGDRTVGVIVLTGAGRGFCAGGDVKAMAERNVQEERPSFEERAQDLRRRMDVARLLHEVPKPTIAMLRGPVAGAGMSLALACDIRIASDTLRMTTAFAKVALSGDFGGSWFLTQLVGPAKARELYFTSPVLGAAEAEALGLINRTVADGALEGETRSLALSLARGPRATLGYIKQNMNLAERASLSDVMDAEALRHTRCTETEDHREAAAAFVEKRAPAFKGR